VLATFLPWSLAANQSNTVVALCYVALGFGHPIAGSCPHDRLFVMILDCNHAFSYGCFFMNILIQQAHVQG